MQNSTEDGIRMVGMDQCRISSVESTASSTDPLLEGGGSSSSRGSSGGIGIGPKSSSSSRVAGFYSQKSRGSHSSAGSGSCSGVQDDCGATEQEPLIPKSKKQPEKEDHIIINPREQGEESEAHINKLHFELFEQCQDDVGRKVEHGLQKEAKKTSASRDSLEVDTQAISDMLKPRDENSIVAGSGESEEKIRSIKQGQDHVKIKHGSKDTVCSSSSSSSSTAATAMVASTHSSNKSSKQNGNGRAGGRAGNNKEKRLRHLSTDTDDTSDISATLEPPDGGWGWVVVAASFLVNCIADGVTFSFGVFFLEFINFFKVSESTTAWIGSLLAAIPLLSGPIASSAVDRYGCRNVTIVGGLLAAIGFVLSSYTTSIYVLMITFGVITGFGLSLCYVAAVVIVAYYFERRRSFATGLSVCGGGIGTFLFAPISQYLIDWYGWQRTTLILAGAFLSLCLCGLLMKDLEWTKKKNKGANNNNSSSHHHHYNLYQSCNGNTLPCHHHHHHHCSSDKSDLTLNGKNSNRRCNSAICIPTFVQEQERRERRQRYYSCNQDYDGQVVKPQQQDASSNEISSSRKSSKKGKTNNSLKSKVLQTSNKKESGSECGENFVGLVPDCPEIYSTPDEEFISDPLYPPLSLPDMIDIDTVTIPLEKDNANTNAVTMTNNGEIVDLAHNSTNPHHQHIIISRAGSSGRINANVAQTEQSSSPSSCTNISRNLINNNEVSECSNSYPYDKNLVASTTNGVVDAVVASSSEFLNYQNNIQLPMNRNNNNFNSQNQSNNSSVTNLNNNINSQMVATNGNSSGRGLKRDNSGSSRRFLYRNKSYNNSINSGSTTQKDAMITTPAPSLLTSQTATPNGIPTIFVPPGQQQQQRFKNNVLGNNIKLDVMNSVRYRSVMHRHSLTYRGAVLNLKRYRLRPASSCPDIISVATSTEGRGSFEFVSMIGDACRWMRSVCEWENLMNTRFLLFILSNLLLYTWYDVPYMYLQTAAVRHGYSEDLSSYLISSIGLFNVVGNIFLGYLGDKTWASATIVYGVCMIICGLTTVLMPYLMEWSYWGLFTICGVFGLTIAANYALTSVILVQVVSLERFANAYGLLLLVQGIGNLVGPPIAGVISDMTGTNTWSFLVAGVGIFASSFFVLAPIFQREDGTPGDHQNHPANHVGQVGHNDTV